MACWATSPVSTGRGGLGAEEQPVLGQFAVEFITHHDGLHPHASAALIDAHDRVELPRKINNQPRAHHLPGQRRAGDARNDSNAVAAPQRG